MEKNDVRKIAVITKQGRGYQFDLDQSKDRYYATEGEVSKPVRSGTEEVKREAQETREKFRKAGLLP